MSGSEVGSSPGRHGQGRGAVKGSPPVHADKSAAASGHRHDAVHSQSKLHEDAELLVAGIKREFGSFPYVNIYHVVRPFSELVRSDVGSQQTLRSADSPSAEARGPNRGRKSTDRDDISLSISPKHSHDVSEDHSPISSVPSSPKSPGPRRGRKIRHHRIFAGPPSTLTVLDFAETLREHGSIYEFFAQDAPCSDGSNSSSSSISGGNDHISPSNKLHDSIDPATHEAEGRKGMQFCWITAPKAPMVDELSHSSCILHWDYIRYHALPSSSGGIRGTSSRSVTRLGHTSSHSQRDVIASNDEEVKNSNHDEGSRSSSPSKPRADATASGAVYVIEISIGPDQQRPGVAKRFATDLTFSDPVEVFRSSSEMQFKVCNLCPARAYRARLIVEYGGMRFPSHFVAFTSPSAPPPQPAAPRFYKRSLAHGEISIKIEWYEPVHVHPPVTYYECYMRKTLRCVDPNIQTQSPSKDEQQAVSPKGRFDAYDEVGEWELNYEGPLNFIKLSVPEFGCVGWDIKMRCQNANGWSEFSPTLSLNWKNQTDLFPSGFYRGIDRKSIVASVNTEEVVDDDYTDGGFVNDSSSGSPEVVVASVDVRERDGNDEYDDDEDFAAPEGDSGSSSSNPAPPIHDLHIEGKDEDLDVEVSVVVIEKPSSAPHSPAVVDRTHCS